MLSYDDFMLEANLQWWAIVEFLTTPWLRSEHLHFLENGGVIGQAKSKKCHNFYKTSKKENKKYDICQTMTPLPPSSNE